MASEICVSSMTYENDFRMGVSSKATVDIIIMFCWSLHGVVQLVCFKIASAYIKAGFIVKKAKKKGDGNLAPSSQVVMRRLLGED